MNRLSFVIFWFFLITFFSMATEGHKVIPLFNGRDLTNWQISEFGPHGPVKVENAKLVLNMGDGATGVTWDGDFDFPTMNYEISLKAMRVDGNDFFCGMTFPVNDDYLTLIVGGWSGSVVGLSSLDGYDASDNETTSSMSFQKKRWYDITLRVQNNVVQVWIDGREKINCDISGYKLSIRPEVDLSRPFGLASWHTKAAFKDIQLTILNDKG